MKTNQENDILTLPVNQPKRLLKKLQNASRFLCVLEENLEEQIEESVKDELDSPVIDWLLIEQEAESMNALRISIMEVDEAIKLLEEVEDV